MTPSNGKPLTPTTRLVDECLGWGGIADMHWPRGTTVDGMPADVEVNWERAVRASGSNALPIVFRGETITTGR